MRRLMDLWTEMPYEPTWKERAVVVIPLLLLMFACCVRWF